MDRKLTRIAGLGLVGLLGSTSLAAADVTVEFWHSFGGESGEALNQIIANFEEANPGITIEAQEVGNYNDIVAKLQAAIPARRPASRWPDA